jgi:CubicO group peptidase (beta-lactamase class C family)
VESLEQSVDAIARQTTFSGVVRVDRGEEIALAKAYGLAHRGYEIPNAIDTQFGIASGTKGFTAATVVSLIADGSLERSTTARSVLGADLPLIHDDVTVELLLSHRSGIGDYLDEETDLDITDYLLSVPAQELATTEHYLAVLDDHPSKFAPGERFAYCNSGYVILALIAERVTGEPFPELVRGRVCEPGQMGATEFLRADELPGRAAVGFLANDGTRTNVFHLPVQGSGDGGIFSTVADLSSFWRSFFADQIVPATWVTEMTRSRGDTGRESLGYGLGFWLREAPGVVLLEGCDAGVSFRSVHDPRREITHTVISNTSAGAWPIARLLEEQLET